MDILREVSDQHLTCSICMDVYNEPKQLPCLHSFCRKCLCTHILKTAGGGGALTFLCPVCRKVCQPTNPDPTQLMRWVDSFPDNFYIKSLLDTLEARQRGMESLPVEERIQDIVKQTEMETCPKHREQAVVCYCVVKKTGVCTICLTSSAHDECAQKHLSPGEARTLAGQQLETFKHRIDKLSDRVKRADEKLASRPSELKFKKEELAIEISQYFSELKTTINKIILKKEKEALEEMKTAIKRENAKIPGVKDETKSLSGSLKSTEQLLDKLHETRPEGALSVTDSVESQISAYERALGRLETECGDLDISIKKGADLGLMLEQLPLGRVRVGREEEKVVVETPVQFHSLTTEKPSGDYKATCEKPSACLQTQKLLTSNVGADNRDSPISTSSRASGESLPRARSGLDLPPSPGRDLPPSPGRSNGAGAGAMTTLQPVSAHLVPSSSDRGFGLTSIHEFNGLNQDDIQNASYVGACPHGQNCLIILDRWNRKLKVIQIGGRILFLLKFVDSNEPWDVTRMSEDRLAVTCPSQCRVLEVKVEATSLSVDRKVSTPIGYSSLQHLHGHLFAAGVCRPFGSPHIDILDTSSDPASIIMPLQVTVTYPRTMGLTLDKHFFVLDWSQKDLCIFETTNFNQLLRYKGTGKEAILREPVSAAKDRVGNLYILDRKLKKVLVLSPSTGAVLSVLELGLQCDPKVVLVVDAEAGYSSSGEVLLVAAGNGRLYMYKLDHP